MRKHDSWQWLWPAAALVAVALAARPSFAVPPELREVDEAVPATARTGEKYIFRIQYLDPDRDRPKEPTLVTEGPEGVRRWPASALAGSTADYGKGATLEFTAGPFDGGEHQAHFEVASIDGKARYPASGGIKFAVENVLVKWIQLAVGLAVALLFLPLMMFVLVRAVNPRSDPSRAARFGLLVGIVASYVWFIILFSTLYSLLWMVALGVLVLGALFALVPRRV